MAFADDYVVPARSVTLGIAPAGTAVEEVALSTPAALTTAGKFSELLSGGAVGDVVAAKVCAGETCTLTSTVVK